MSNTADRTDDLDALGYADAMRELEDILERARG